MSAAAVSAALRMLCTWLAAVVAREDSRAPSALARPSSSNSTASARRWASTAAGSYPLRPIGKSRLSIACRSRSTAAILSDVARRGLICLKLPQVPSQFAQLVAQLRRVLEPQLVGGRDHLLLELHHHSLELVLGHLLLRPPPPAPLARARYLRLGLKELGDVGDPLHDRRRRDPVPLVVGELDLPPAVGLRDRRAHRLRLLVGVHEDRAVHVA